MMMHRMIGTRRIVCSLLHHPRRCASSLSLLKDLRARTGAPVVDCQKAIRACPDVTQEGDLTPILDWLRLHSSAKVIAKVAGRSTDQGLVGFYRSADAAVLVKVAAETDFAAHSDAFGQFLQTVLPTLCAAPASTTAFDDPEALLRLVTADGRTLQDALHEAQIAIRENIGIAHVYRWQQPDDADTTYHAYVHNCVNGSTPNLGTAAAGVVLRGASDEDETMRRLGKHLAMHIVAARPLYQSIDDIPAAVREKERDLIAQQCQDAKKPPAIVEKMIQGKMQKYYESVCLLEQAHMIEEGNPKIQTFLQQHNVTLQEYHYLSI